MTTEAKKPLEDLRDDPYRRGRVSGNRPVIEGPVRANSAGRTFGPSGAVARPFFGREVRPGADRCVVTARPAGGRLPSTRG